VLRHSLAILVRQALSIVLACSCIELTATVTRVKSWDELQPVFDNLSPQTLVVLDVDWTLITPSDRILQPYTIPSIEQLMKQAVEKTQRVWNKQINSKLYQQRKAQLLDKNILNCLKKIRGSQSKAVALTALQTGAYGSIASLEDWRCQELQSLGVDFRSLCPLKNHHKFHSLAHYDQIPVLQQGILFSAYTPKGEVLASFLDYVESKKGWRPHKVIFIDDNASFIASVATSMRQRGIPFQGYHILHSPQILSKQEISIALKQLTYFLQKGKWLSDSKVEQYLP
jgi:hypothetical protein